MSDPVFVGGLSFLFFVVGFVSSSLLLLFVPKLYKKLAGVVKKCRRSSTSHRASAPAQPTVRSSNYTEIDDSKTRTFANPNYPSRAARDQPASKDQDRTPGYYNVPPTRDCKAHAYEDLEVKKASPQQPPEVNHVYRIVDPGTSKKLEVKLVSGAEETISSDPNHVYFVLEPGTNKVRPVHMGTDTASKKPDHVYFVLEPNSSTNPGSEAEPYAVNDLHAEHAYFIIEKQPLERSSVQGLTRNPSIRTGV